MENCKTCKANKICDHNKYGFENCGNYIPSDVVPKSEYVDMEIRALRAEKQLATQQDLAESRKYDIEHYLSEIDELQNAKSEVAREIIAEVRQALLNMVLTNAMGENYDIEKRFAEIEKKYTEGE